MAPVTIAGALTLAHAEALAGHHARADRAAGCAGRVRQLHLERRHEVRLAGIRHARVRQGGVRRGPAGALPRPALALLERDGLERPRCAGRLRIADEPVGRAARRLQLRAARRRLARERTDRLLREVHPRRRDAADVRRGVSAGRRDAADIGLDAVAEVGPGGHFFGCAHTMERYAAPSTRRWSRTGATTASWQRTARRRRPSAPHSGRARWSVMSRPRAIPRCVEALDAYVARRTEEGGAPPVT